jgi:hypothetical protein
MHADPQHWRIGLVGYGEVGRILAEDLRAQGVAVAAWDLKLASPASAAPLHDHAGRHGVVLAASAADLAAGSDLIVSAVTASQAVPVAADCAPAIRPGAFFLDFNSASPGAKQRAAALVDGAGGRYVEGAVMTSIPPYRIRVPLLLGGSSAASAGAAAQRAGLRCQDGERAPGRGQRHQDVPQRDDQGPGGHGHRELHRGAVLRRGRRGAGQPARDLSRHRLGEAGRLFLPAGD